MRIMNEAVQELEPHTSKESEIQKETTAMRRSRKKIKTTIYLTEEAEQAFTELYIHRLRKDRKIDRSMIACDAIQALFEKECGTPSD
jgi:hypothetical protein